MGYELMQTCKGALSQANIPVKGVVGGGFVQGMVSGTGGGYLSLGSNALESPHSVSCFGRAQCGAS